MIKINFSGHPVEGFSVAPFVGVNLPMGSAEELAQMVKETICALSDSAALKQGAAAEVVLPGMSPVAAVLLAEWHGQFGFFPTVRWAVREASGFVWPDATIANLQQIRDDARRFR